MSLSQSDIDAARKLYHHTWAVCPRHAHGMQHAARVTVLATLWMNLYQLEGISFSEDEKRWIEIATLLHDSARQDDGEDLWDQDSALNVYHHLIITHHIPVETAAWIAECMANKDAEPGASFYTLNPMSITWTEGIYDVQKQTSHGRLIDVIHDADCLDIIRARKVFDMRYLRFYKKYVTYVDTPEGPKLTDLGLTHLELLSYIVIATRGLIATQGDSYESACLQIKHTYEYDRNPFEKTLQDIQSIPQLFALKACLATITLKQDSLISALLETIQIMHQQLLRQSLPDNLATHFIQKTLYVRGIESPAQPTKRKRSSKKPPLLPEEEETNAELELRKIHRQRGVPTRRGSINKEGNPKRSTSALTPATDFFSCFGLLVAPPIERIISVSQLDADTGMGKRKNSSKKPPNTQEETQRQLTTLHIEALLGITRKMCKRSQATSSYSEIEADIHQQDIVGIFYTHNKVWRGAKHPAFIPLTTIYIQQLLQVRYQRLYPIIEYHQDYNFYEQRTFDTEEILSFWETVLNKLFTKEKIADLIHPERIFKQYGLDQLRRFYSPALNAAVSLLIQNQRLQEKLQERLSKLLVGHFTIEMFTELSKCQEQLPENSRQIFDAYIFLELEPFFMAADLNPCSQDYQQILAMLIKVLNHQDLWTGERLKYILTVIPRLGWQVTGGIELDLLASVLQCLPKNDLNTVSVFIQDFVQDFIQQMITEYYKKPSWVQVIEHRQRSCGHQRFISLPDNFYEFVVPLLKPEQQQMLEEILPKKITIPLRSPTGSFFLELGDARDFVPGLMDLVCASIDDAQEEDCGRLTPISC